MAITQVFAGVAVTDYDSVLGWYERLMGRPADMIPKENKAIWQVAETRERTARNPRGTLCGQYS